MHAHLGGRVYAKLGQLAPYERSKPYILNDDRVGVKRKKLRRKIERGRKLAVKQQRVQRDMGLYPAQAAVVYRLTQGVARKILRSAARVESAASEIDGVRPV